MANEDVFNNLSGKMTGGVGSLGLPSRTGEPRRPAPEVTAPPPAPPIPKAGFYRGDGGYEYVVGDKGQITIANSPNARGIGKTVELDSAFYDDIAEELAGKQVNPAIPGPVIERLKMAQAPKAAMPKAAAPKANVVADAANVEIESAMPPAASAPMPEIEMTSDAYEDALLAAPQGSKAPPPPTPAPRRGSRTASGETGAVLDAIPTPREAFSGYRASVQMQSAEESAVRALVDNGMDRTAARAFVTRLVDTQGEQAIPLLNSLGDPKPYVPRAQRR